ncbi:MAG TPA: 2-dehydropantoate 2-reductase [Vicinamibacteria bacterium]|nr:2-dehydropantoate 2-reductase [Vicinamibacteria bacterium]
MTAAPRVLVVGTGGLACALGAGLSRAGGEVTLAGSWSEALAAIEARGIVVHQEEETWTARPRAVAVDGGLDPVSLALVLVKSHSTTRAAAALGGALEPDGLAVTLQNGLGNRETLRAVLGSERVLAGVAILGATVLGPGEVRLVAGRVVLERDPRGRGEALARLLRTAGLGVETTDDLPPIAWTKLAANCAINPLTALHRLPNGALLEDAQLRAELGRAAREVGAVAEACGIRLPRDAGQAALEICRATAGNRSSMLQDVERGAPTEIDALNGAVAREGRRLGVPTPVNDHLFAAVRALEGRPLAAEAARP